MSLVKFAHAEITGVKGSESRLGRTASLDHFADYDDYRTDDGYIYVRVRAISSRVNKNHDGWPSEELAKSFRTFLGKPIFVDHNNSDPERHRGVVVDAKLHIEEPSKTAGLDSYYAHAPSEHLPPTWIELLLETDAKTFPKLAKALTTGAIDGVSMGCNVERSKCSHCGNWATVPEQYCQHIRDKGAEYDYYRDGMKTSKKSYEDCYDIGFFEISYVFDPADETALIREVKSNQGLQKAASTRQADGNPAARARQNKEAHPEQYCPNCLWHTNPQAQPGDAPQPCPRHGGPERGQDASGKDTGPITAAADGKACANCGKNMNPAEVMVAGKNGVCGACARKNQKEVTGAGIDGWSGAPNAGGEGGAKGIPGWSGAPNTSAPSNYFEDPQEYANYLHHTLIPDLHESGSSETAQDFQTIHDHITNGTRDPDYEQWLQSTLIPDLHDSGKEFTANDLQEGIHHMQSGSYSGDPNDPADGRAPSHRDAKVASTKTGWGNAGDGYNEMYDEIGDDIPGANEPAAGEVACPTCGGPGMYLGSLGKRHHFRCRNCGNDFSEHGDQDMGAGMHDEAPGGAYPTDHDNDIGLGSYGSAAKDEEDDEDDLAEYNRRFKRNRENAGDVTSADKSEGGCPTCGSRSIEWWDTGAEGQCRNCGHKIKTAAGGGDLASYILQLGAGKHQLEIGSVPFTIYYDEQGAMGDNNMPVQGDKTGEWEVFVGHDLGMKNIARIHVSPHGDSGYGNAGAPAYAAQEVAQAITKYVQSQAQQGQRPTEARTADTQQLPQSELVHAPQDVNTLRQEQVCPVCGNQIDDGKCNVCGFEEAPEGFGNPDLNKAQEVNQEQEAADMAQGGPGGQPPVPVAGPDGGQGSPPPGPSPMGSPGPGASAMPLQAAASVSVSSDRTSALSGGTKGGQPILPATQQASDRPKNEKRIQDSSKPVESSSREETMTDNRKTSAPDNEADRLRSDRHRTVVVDVDGEGGVISEENPIGHKNVNVDGVGAVDNDENPEGHKEESLDSSLKEEVGGPTKTWGKGEGDSLGQHSPVGGGGDSALASTKRSLQIFPVTDPKSVKLDAGLKEEVGPPTSTFGTDSFHTTDPVTGEVFPPANEGVKPEGKGVPDRSPFPPANEGVKAARRQFMASLRLAETEVALGILPAEQKLNRMSELESEPTAAIEAQLAAYSKVKTAGLKKTAKASKGSLPSLKQSSVERESTIRQVEAHDETVVLAESIFS